MRLFFTLLVATQAFGATILPDSKRITWQGNVGVPGGIPTRTTVYTNLPSGSSASEIQAAIDACPSNQVVALAEGEYTITNAINLKSGVTLRGAGMNTTKLLTSGVTVGINVAGETTYDWDAPVAANHVSWISNYAQGATVIGLSATNLAGSAASVPVGRLLFIDQLNDSNTCAYGTYDSATPGGYTSIGKPNTGEDRYQSQLSRVVAVDGTTVTIAPGIYMPNYAAESLPQVWWESANPIELAGVEDIWVAVTNTIAYGVYFNNAYGCWSKNVRTTQARRHHSLWRTLRCEVRHCMMEAASGSTDDYTVSVYNSSGALIEDNIFHQVDTALVVCGMSGSVFSYNYVTNLGSGDFMKMGVYLHGGHPNMNLFEGNVGVAFAADNGWGSAIYNTVLRNRWTGFDESHSTAYQNYRQPIVVGATNRFHNIIGNVLGTTGINDWYESAAEESACHEDGRIYFIGYKPTYCALAAYDPVTYDTLLRAYNWDSATATNSGVVTGGYVVSDVPNSYYLSGKPSYFADLTWPPVNPDNAAYSSSRTNIPAGYRLVYGTDPVSASPATPAVNTRTHTISGTINIGTLRRAQ